MTNAALAALKEARVKAGLSQSDVAEKLGVSVSSYSGYERGARDPSVAQLTKLAEILSIPVAVFFGSKMQQPVAGTEEARLPSGVVGYLMRRMEPWPRGVNAIAEIVRLLPRSQQEIAYSLVVSLAISSQIEIPDGLKLTDNDFLDHQAPAFR